MATWDERQFRQSLSDKEIHPLYLLYGEEVFLLDEAVKGLKAQALGDGLEDFNFNVFYGRDKETSQVRDVIETLPMMAQRRVVILKEAQDCKEADFAELLPVIEQPVQSTTFIIVAAKIDKRKKFFKNFQKHGVMVEFRKPFENQIPAWIKYIAQKHSLNIDDPKANLIQQMVGSNLLSIDNEMRKLAQYKGESSQVEFEDIHNVVSHSRVDNVFQLTEAIGSKDRAGALVCLANLLENGQNEVGALSLITRHIRILATIKQAMSEGFAGAKLSAKAGVPHFFLKKYVSQSQQWKMGKLQFIYKALLDTDRALKSSPLSSHIWLENLIIRTCS